MIDQNGNRKTMGSGITLRFRYMIICLMGFTFFSCSTEPGETEHLKLWYDQPAKVDNPQRKHIDRGWLKALPLGNGSLGVMVFGDVNSERIQLNEESIWSGGLTDNDNPDAYASLDKIRELLFAGKYKEATELTDKTQVCKGFVWGRDGTYGRFQTLGDLWIDKKNQASYENYHRELDLEEAVVRVDYTQEGVNYKREIFTSFPDQVMVARFTADQPGKISFTCSLDRPERFRTYSENDHLIMRGAFSDGSGGGGLQYMTRLKAVNNKGTVSYSDSTIIVDSADEVILYLSASTDYVLSYPDYEGRDYEKITNENIEKAVAKSFDDLMESHIKEYQPYFNRVSFDITPEPLTEIPTDIRVESFKETLSDPHLVELFFQYGRYLLISSSRPGTLPANLQGVWTDKLRTPWAGDYHTDVNVEMNYWLAGVTNLSELQLPLFDLIESLVEPGQKTASVQYHKKGWIVHPITNVWGFTSPGNKASWGMHTGAGAWICSHIMEHYAYTGDKEFLQRMYPVLKGSVEFYMDWLVEHPVSGELVSGPAVSPENTFIAPDGSESQFSMGPAHDQQVIWQLFSDFISASGELNKEDQMVFEVKNALARLAGPKIGSDGRLMEWAEEFPEVEPGHRHISHLFALHPGFQINLEQSPELALAAKKSLDFRIENGGGHTGWSAAWLINQYARLREADKAKESLNTVLSKSIAPNLFGLHPPFQIDANFGGSAGIAEMLIQSHSGTIHLLPALPEAWSSGEVTGLKARGGYEINLNWENHELTKAMIRSEQGKPCKLRYRGEVINLDIKRGGKRTIHLTDF